MPGMILGLGTGATNTPNPKRPDRWLNFQYAFPPERDLRDREDAPGARNPYNLWPPSDLIGGEETGMSVMKLVTYDDDIKFGGTKAFSYQITGQVQDSGGTPLPGVIVELWQITDLNYPDSHQPLLIGTTRADANGIYGFAVPGTVTQYKIEAYDGSRGGVTVRNITGS